MKIEYIKNPVWANEAHTMINLTVKLTESNEELPFTASPDDREEHGRAMFAQAKAGQYGPISQYQPPPAITPDQLASQARAQRDHLLAESDWTQLPDARAAMGPQKSENWDAYRKELREIPLQPGFPTEINWPQKPT